jgi:hypothetical protein
MADDSIGVDGPLVEGLFKEKGALAALLGAVCGRRWSRR